MRLPEVLWKDDDLLAIGKPSGVASHPGWASRQERTALSLARELAGCLVYPVHRLDRATSGVLLFALDPEAASLLGRAQERGEFDKTYLALVRGYPPQEGTIDHPVPRREKGPRVDARTDFATLARSPHDRCSLVQARPRTGRLHQIRRHLKHITHPLVGDVRYGKGDINRHYREHWNLHRLALHALRLVVPHPRTGERVVLCAPVPPDLREPLVALGLEHVL